MSITLPLNNIYSNYSFSSALDGSTYRFVFIYNGRSKQWVMNISDINRNPIINGIKLVLNYSLLDQYTHLNLPPGELYAIDTTEKEIEFNIQV